jgi:hypothetical protein
MQRTIQRARRRNQPPLPETTLDIKLTDTEWERSISGEVWCRSFVCDNEQCLLFSTNSNLNRISQSEVWYGDGTFSVTPKPFYQLYTIHGVVLGQVLPLIYVLLPKKSLNVYRQMFVKIQELLFELGLVCRFTTWRCDFEQALINAVMDVWHPEVELCFFHLCQAHWRKLSGLGFKDRYTHDLEFSIQCKMFSALAFLPADKIKDAFATRRESCTELYPDLEEFCDYFQSTYVGSYKAIGGGDASLRLTWVSPLFPATLWSVYERTSSSEPRTTNKLEGWHRRFAQIIGKSHPNVFEFISRLKEEQSHTEFKIEQYMAGVQPPSSRSSVVKNNKRLLKVVTNIESMSVPEYLRGVAHNITY